MNDICLPKLVEILASDVKTFTSQQQACDLLKSLYGFLDFADVDWAFLSDEHKIFLKQFMSQEVGFCELYIQRILVEMIKRLDTQSKAKAAFRKATRPESEGLFRHPDSVQDNIMCILQSIESHFIGNIGELSDNQMMIGLENIHTLLCQCCREPYLRSFAPLYIFLRYKYAGEDFFIKEIPSDDVYIYSYLKHNKNLYNQKYERKDIDLMCSLMSATGSWYPLLQQAMDRGTDTFAMELNEIISNNEFDIPAPLSSYLPIPNWNNILYLLLAQGKINEESISKYLTLLTNNSQAQNSDDEIMALLLMIQRITHPQNYWSKNMGIQPSTPYKIALRTVCQILCPENYREEMSAEEMFDLLERRDLFSAINLSLYAFFRITRYRPSGFALAVNKQFNHISETFDFLLRSQIEIINSELDFPLLPIKPSSKSVFNQTHQVCHEIYEKWRWDDTIKFCGSVLPLAVSFQNQQEYQLESFFSDLEESCHEKNAVKIANILGQDNIRNLPTAEEVLIDFVTSILKKTKPLKTFLALVGCGSIDRQYCLQTVLRQCLSLTIWDLQERFWTFQYELLDYLYPLRGAK